MLPSGELLIINISHSDAQHTYRCRTYHQLTQEVIVSGNFGRIQLSGNNFHANQSYMLEQYIFMSNVNHNIHFHVECRAFILNF